ncbi:MAG: AEC family transporter [Kiritimatiellae bacterium]|nr:AEC family transporter [Kiritimatiellia bacterium]
MFLSVAGILFPVFALLALGACLRHAGFLSEAFAAGLNKLVFYGALPCLLVDSIARSNPAAGSGRAALALALSTVGIAAVAWLLAVPMGVARASRPSFCQTVFRSNNAYVGLPVMALAFAGRPFEADGMALATLTLAPCLLLYNAMAVAVLTRPDETAPPARRFGRVLLGMLRNPLILACLAGLALLALRIRLGATPDAWAASSNPLLGTVRLFGSMATPGSLVALGASLTPDRLRASVADAHKAALLKLVVCPCLGFGVCLLLGLPPLHRFIVLCYLACPSAVASYVMAEAMGGDARLAGSAVALTTVYSAFSLAAVLLAALPG